MRGAATVLQAAAVRELPPYGRLLNLRFEERDDGLMIVMPYHEDVIGRPGNLHGGAIAGLLEFTAWASLEREIGDESVNLKPVTVTIDYMRPGVERDTFASAVIQRLGTNIANVEALAWQARRSQPIAGARLNFLLERPPRR